MYERGVWPAHLKQNAILLLATTPAAMVDVRDEYVGDENVYEGCAELSSAAPEAYKVLKWT